MAHSFVFDNKNDPVLRAIAQELHTSLNHQPTPANNNSDFELDSSATTLHAYQFRLESFLTRPRTCTTLFPPRVQKSRYSQILVQERLVLLSAAAASPSSSTSSTTDTDKDVETDKEKKESQDVLIAGLEVLEYTLTPLLPSTPGDKHPRAQREERIAYIAKVDTSGYWPLPGLEAASLRGKSPAQALVKGYLRSVRAMSRHGLSPSSSTSPSTNAAVTGITDTSSSSDINNNSATAATAGKMSALSITPASTSITSTTLHRSRPQKTSLYIFARAQPQYLFAESAKNPQKRVLDDRGLVRWWKNTAASIYADSLEEESPPTTITTQEQEQEHEGQGKKSEGESKKKGTKVQGWWHIPGIETERQAHNVIQSNTTASSGTFKWTYGYPDKDSKELANALIPQFPDDPKSRMMQSPSCQGGFVNIQTFWELAAIGEESGAGKITGFFRIEEEANDGSEVGGEGEKEEVENGVQDVKEKAVTGTTAGYTKVINFLLDLDFSTLESARKSTRTWRDRVEVWVRKSIEKEAEHALEVKIARQQGQQQGEGEKDDSKKENEEKERDVVVVARPLWIQKGTVEILLRHASEAALPTTTTAAISLTETVLAPAAPPMVVNTLGMGLIKRKAPTPNTTTTTSTATVTASAVNVLGTGLIKRKVAPTSTSTTPAPSATPAPALSASPVVNVLGAGLIKRKIAPTSTSTIPAPTPSAPETSFTAPVVNVLGASFIKKRKTNP